MDINQYSIYSAISVSKDKSEQELLKILEQADEFKKIREAGSAKEYLKKIWGIEKSIKNYALCDRCTLNVIESEKTFCVNLVYNKNDVTYYYKK